MFNGVPKLDNLYMEISDGVLLFIGLYRMEVTTCVSLSSFLGVLPGMTHLNYVGINVC